MNEPEPEVVGEFSEERASLTNDTRNPSVVERLNYLFIIGSTIADRFLPPK